MYASYGNYSGRLLRGDLDFRSTPLSGHIGTVKYSDGVARQVSTREGFSVVGKALDKILKLVGYPCCQSSSGAGWLHPCLVPVFSTT